MELVQELYNNFQYEHIYVLVSYHEKEYSVRKWGRFLCIACKIKKCLLDFSRGTMKVYHTDKLPSTENIPVIYWLILKLAINESLERLYILNKHIVHEVD